MPAPARISVPVKQATSAKSSASPTLNSPPSISRPKARVVHRRRARGRLGDTESDDELVREPHSDSDSESATSTLESESLSESELEIENQNSNEATAEARVPSPSRIAIVAPASTSSPPSQSSPRPFLFQPSHDWSEMVADENANGAAALPVIDFADISSHVETSSSPSHAVPSPPASVQERFKTPRGATEACSSSTITRKPAQSARQAYLTRLDSDPAYVPTLGQFWSHDDRLLDKELRSLSGWWRGRWQGRGRGARGRGGLGPRGRGSFGGMRGARNRGSFGNGGPSRPGDVLEEDTPPADRSWTHDGFEELQDDESNHQSFPYRGRGAFPRGRGGHRGSFPYRGSRNGSSSPREPQAHPVPEPEAVFQQEQEVYPQPEPQALPPPEPQAHPLPEPQVHIPPEPHTRARPRPLQSATSDLLRFGNGTRPWFAMKPERVWTKQFDGYLYFEAELKPVHNQGIGQGVRIKLPRMKNVDKYGEGLDNDAVVVRVPPWNPIKPWTVPSTSKEPLADRAITVRLPPSRASLNEHEAYSPEDVITVAPPPMDEPIPSLLSVPAPSYRPRPTQEDHPYTSSRPLVHSPWHSADTAQPSGSTSAPLDLLAEAPKPQEVIRNEPSMVNHATSAGSSHSRIPIHPHDQENSTVSPQDLRPSMVPVLQATPPFQPSPSYGSPYPYATTSGPPLPPGIAISEDGVTYEIATGRTVYLHTPPPPPPPPMQIPVYNPRPMPMHPSHHGSVHFLPPHAHGHASSMSMSVSPPAFLASPSMFALPRQSSRVEIRAPGEEKGKNREVAEHAINPALQTGSTLAANVNAEPFTPASHLQPQAMGYYSTDQQAFDNAQHHQQQSIYQPPPFYYPVNADGSASYGYGQPYAGVEASQAQYDSYGQESYPQQHAVYY